MRASLRTNLSLTFMVLIPSPAGDDVADRLGLALNPDAAIPGIVLLSEVRGNSYLSARGEEGRRLNEQWALEVEDREVTEPVFVMLYEPGLEDLIPGLDASFVIGAPTLAAQRALEEAAEPGHELDVIITSNPYVVAHHVLEVYGRGEQQRPTFLSEGTPAPSPARSAAEQVAEEIRVQIEAADFPEERLVPAPEPGLEGTGAPRWPAPGDSLRRTPPPPEPSDVPPYLKVLSYEQRQTAMADLRQYGADEVEGTEHIVAPPVRPPEKPPAFEPPKDSFMGFLTRAKMPPAPDFDPVLEAPVPEQEPVRTRVEVRPTTEKAPGGRSLLRGKMHDLIGRIGGKAAQSGEPAARQVRVSAEFADKVAALRGAAVCVYNTKGGVGKTATTCGVAVTAGIAADMRFGRCMILDANQGNTSTYRSLGIRQDLCSVKELVDTLGIGDGAVPRQPAFANTPGLGVYREEAEGGIGYPFDKIVRARDFILESYNGLLFVDTHNSPPVIGETTGEVVAYWLMASEMVIMPVDPDPDTFEQSRITLNHLERIGEMQQRHIPVIAAYIEPTRQDVRELPSLQEDLAKLRERVVDIAAVPRDERYYMALRTGQSIVHVAPNLTRAYTSLAEKVVDTLLLARQSSAKA